MREVWVAVLWVALAAAPAAAGGWRATAPAVLYDAPSAAAGKLLILSGGHPLREISRVDGWRKVTIFSGEIGWVREEKTAPFEAVVVVSDRAAARVAPNAAAAAVFFAQRGVVLEALEAFADGWIKTVHPDGEVGFVQVGDGWVNR